MRRATFLLTTLALFLAGCGGGGGGGNGGAPVTPLGTWYYVDAQTGSDQNDGSELQPFKTITHALDQTQQDDVVFVAPGLYDAVHGEAFPIHVPNGVHLHGDEDHRGAGSTPTHIIGGAPASNQMVPGFPTYAAVELHAHASITGFSITNPLDTPMGIEMAVALNHPSSLVEQCTIRDNPSLGIGAWGAGTDLSIVNNHIIHNGTGLNVRTSALVRVQQNKITNNDMGVRTWWGIDMGGGAMGSTGGNTIAWNTDNDLYVINGTGITVMAQDNRWNHVGPTTYVGSTNPANGLDVLIYNGQDSVDTTGAKLALIVIPAPLP